jgi:uncharacterized protein YjbJ (UPF0337 family)
MDIPSIKGAMNIAKGRLKQKLANLSGDKYHLAEGKQDEQIGRLQKRAAETRQVEKKAIKEARSKKKGSG